MLNIVENYHARFRSSNTRITEDDAYVEAQRKAYTTRNEGKVEGGHNVQDDVQEDTRVLGKHQMQMSLRWPQRRDRGPLRRQ